MAKKKKEKMIEEDYSLQVATVEIATRDAIRMFQKKHGTRKIHKRMESIRILFSGDNINVKVVG